ncbi:hypothetical protein CI109_106585 [Kwoniella shandongensis]|uniref:TECPR1-like DysF domain-containing protein n=1 Tax=Kwoniella shandongensis TaxID=1734106 RepID=A0A5M6C750_9TREE|nr:uncharacterized protein CI109_002767 [Kwoniella shandongensis]KAA5529009.1 hypothetical protein CI109_002767 [Kwoniella shandongensis]
MSSAISPGSGTAAAPPHIPAYLLSSLPPSAIPIPPPSSLPSTSTSTSNNAPHPIKSTPSFPPTSGGTATTTTKGKTPTGLNIGMSLPSLSTNVSDLLLSSLLPPNLPKTTTSKKVGAGAGGGVGVPRDLTSQREGLSLNLLSNNFRRFVTRVGPVFWLQDRVEEVLFWRKPVWTWAWMLVWTFISFQPRTLLLLPSLTLMLILLHTHEKIVPVPSLLGIIAPPPTATDRINPTTSSGTSNNNTSTATSATNAASTAVVATRSSPNLSTGNSTFSASTTKDADGETVGVPVVPPQEVQSGVDYYMNIQAIQNLMGLISDAYDYVAPRLTSLQSPNPSPSPLALPITHTHLILLLLPPTLFLPLTPSQFIPYLLLPLGLVPPLIFHPNLTPTLLALPTHPLIRNGRAMLEGWLMSDRLSDEIGRKRISRVEVWENERLDPKIAALSTTSTTSVSSSSSSTDKASQGAPIIPPGSWSARFLRPSDRPPWVKVATQGNKWKSVEDNLPSTTSESTTGGGGGGEREAEAKRVLALKEGWEWVPGEDWRVDGAGLWSDVGVDEEGWVYSDDSWQNVAPSPYTEADTLTSDKITTVPAGMMPGLALGRITRRRRWWKRVYEVSESV